MAVRCNNNKGVSLKYIGLLHERRLPATSYNSQMVCETYRWYDSKRVPQFGGTTPGL